MKRRDLLRTAAVAGSAALAGWAPTMAGGAAAVEATKPQPTARELARKLPRWRGFNLLEKFMVHSNKPFAEADFEWIAEWGFDWVRLPLDYRCWTDKDDPHKLDEMVLKEIDQAVEFGRRHKIHVCLCLHRAPGYTVASPPEKLDLWKDEEAQKQFEFQWAGFAKRYKGVAATALSFDLVNEPGNVAPGVYAKPARRAVEAIRKEDPERLIVSDGVQWGNVPVFQLVDTFIAQSTRGYAPMEVTHYKAEWVGGGNWPEPTWPLKKDGKVLDRKWLQETCIAPWKKLEEKSVGVHVGEWGCHNRTPHGVVLAWSRDCLSNWKDAGWGWGLWNLRGSFGILDSDRADVKYEDFHGRKLDRKLLDVLREF